MYGQAHVLWKPKVNVGNHPQLLFHCVHWGRGSKKNPEFTDMASITRQASVGILFPSSKDEITGETHCPLSMHKCSGDPKSDSWTCIKHFDHWVISQPHLLHFLFFWWINIIKRKISNEKNSIASYDWLSQYRASSTLWTSSNEGPWTWNFPVTLTH